MMFVLTQQEYDGLREARKHEIQLSKKKLQDLCTKIADEMPVKFWGRKEASVWGCILTIGDEHCCDECPVTQICPHESKEWSQ